MNNPRRITLERTWQAPLEDVWDLWTTKEGIESWWGPEGFVVEVRALDLRPGGLLDYAMTAVAPPQVDFMKRAGMPLTHALRLTYTEVVPRRRLAYTNLVDFVPGVAPYPSATLVELEAGPRGVTLRVTIDAMHDEEWTQRAVLGWNSELDKLGRLLARAG